MKKLKKNYFCFYLVSTNISWATLANGHVKEFKTTEKTPNRTSEYSSYNMNIQDNNTAADLASDFHTQCQVNSEALKSFGKILLKYYGNIVFTFSVALILKRSFMIGIHTKPQMTKSIPIARLIEPVILVVESIHSVDDSGRLKWHIEITIPKKTTEQPKHISTNALFENKFQNFWNLSGLNIGVRF